MIGTIHRYKAPLFAAVGLIAVAAVGTTSYAGQSQGSAQATEPVPCEVVALTSGNTTSLEAIYNAPGAVNGQYRFSVKARGAGSSNISQGGGFYAPEAGPVSLSRVTISTASDYDVTFTLEIDGRTFDCPAAGEQRA